MDGIDLIAEHYKELVDLLRRKNKGYAGHATDDMWINFRECEPIITAPQGVMARAGDKWNRLKSLMLNEQNNQVEENIYETIDDLINYLAIMRQIMLDDKMKKKPGESMVKGTVTPSVRDDYSDWSDEVIDNDMVDKLISHWSPSHTFYCHVRLCPAYNDSKAGLLIPETAWNEMNDWVRGLKERVGWND